MIYSIHVTISSPFSRDTESANVVADICSNCGVFKLLRGHFNLTVDYWGQGVLLASPLLVFFNVSFSGWIDILILNYTSNYIAPLLTVSFGAIHFSFLFF